MAVGEAGALLWRDISTARKSRSLIGRAAGGAAGRFSPRALGEGRGGDKAGEDFLPLLIGVSTDGGEPVKLNAEPLREHPRRWDETATAETG